MENSNQNDRRPHKTKQRRHPNTHKKQCLTHHKHYESGPTSFAKACSTANYTPEFIKHKKEFEATHKKNLYGIHQQNITGSTYNQPAGSNSLNTLLGRTRTSNGHKEL